MTGCPRWDCMAMHSGAWLRRFEERGYPAARPLAAGMEAEVYELDEGSIAKVWRRRQGAELTQLQAFYEELAGADLGFATPRVFEVWEEKEAAVTVEQRLPGVPLDRARPLNRPLRPDSIACVLDVLEGLRHAGELESLRALPVLEERRAMWEGYRTWPAALGALLERRVEAHGAQLRTQLPEFDRAAARLLELVAGVEVGATAPVHGDLIPANVLVDDSLRPVAVLDFGFLTTIGDPLFDLAVTASVYDMYGPRGGEIEAVIDHAASRRWDLPPERLALYRAVYAFVTASVYDASGNDGHFRWCIELLRRPEVAALLGLDRGHPWRAR